MNVLDELKTIPEFKDLPETQLKWLVEEGTMVELSTDDYIFKPGDPIDRLLIVLQGHGLLKTQQGNQFRVIGSLEKYSITGYLPYSRASVARGYAQVTEPSSILTLHKENFREMINKNEELTTALVHIMSTRIRDFTKREQLNDKMMSLGKLSAGLAHEINNPSAAIVRGAQSLKSHLKLLPSSFKNVIKIRMTDDQVDQVNDILFSRLAKPANNLSLMERSRLEDELLDWLDEREIENADEIADTLVTYGFQESDLEAIMEVVPSKDLPAIMNWINQVITTERLVTEIEEASQRINSLVSSIKSYTHMDQAPEKQPTDIHLGIENTLTMLNHKLKGINVVKKFQSDLPKPKLFISEINQVWTNLIDNAADAMEKSSTKELTLRTQLEGEYINVFITDSGSGIPEEIQGQIFDPFFTTKEIGKGTGLGMEIVFQVVQNQHNGSISFTSQPGKTEFKVSLPIN